MIDLEAGKPTMSSAVKTVHDIVEALVEIQRTVQVAFLLNRHDQATQVLASCALGLG